MSAIKDVVDYINLYIAEVGEVHINIRHLLGRHNVNLAVI